ALCGAKSKSATAAAESLNARQDLHINGSDWVLEDLPDCEGTERFAHYCLFAEAIAIVKRRAKWIMRACLPHSFVPCDLKSVRNPTDGSTRRRWKSTKFSTTAMRLRTRLRHARTASANGCRGLTCAL